MPIPSLTDPEKSAATELLQALLRIDTTNPPGNERPAIERVCRELEAIGIDGEIVGESEDRPNLVGKWEAPDGPDKARPLILSSHLDVVPADETRWKHPPFSGHNDGTHLWGRGAIDMKGFAAMALAALKKLRSEGPTLKRDVLFVAVSDEEAGTRLGSRWLVDNRPDLLGSDPEYVINEVGGFTVHRNGKRFYPVQVAEKGVAWLRLTVEGTPGHSSLPATETAITLLAKAIEAIATTRLPWHPSEEAARFLAAFAKEENPLSQKFAPLLLKPGLGPKVIDKAIPDPSRRASVEAILRNTANPTRIRAGETVNSLPTAAHADIDGRLAPGQKVEDLLRALTYIGSPLLGENFRFEILHESSPVSFSPETPLFEAIEKAMLEFDPEGHVVPSIVPGFTDSSNYARLGATCYGFYPLPLPEDLDFAAMFHGDNERIPIEGFHQGIEILTNLLRDFVTV